MKNLFIPFAFLIFYTSCEKCYECTALDNTEIFNQASSTLNSTTSIETEFPEICGDAYDDLKASEGSSTSTSGVVTTTVNRSVTCKEK